MWGVWGAFHRFTLWSSLRFCCHLTLTIDTTKTSTRRAEQSRTALFLIIMSTSSSSSPSSTAVAAAAAAPTAPVVATLASHSQGSLLLGSLSHQMGDSHHMTTNDFANTNSTCVDPMDEDDNDIDDDGPPTTLVAKFGKERITLAELSSDTTIGEVKLMLQEKTRILPKRQKLVGLVALQGGAKGVTDDLPLSGLKCKQNTAAAAAAKNNASSSALTTVPAPSSVTTLTHQFILMGTPEEAIFIDPSDRDDLPDVVDDFDLDFNAGSDEWLQHVATEGNLKKFTEQTEVFFMNPPRDNVVVATNATNASVASSNSSSIANSSPIIPVVKPLLVLDLDHTLLDFSSKTLIRDGSTHVVGQGLAAVMKRPYMDQFLTSCYQYYDLVVWSQTSWRWLETKLTELGMLTHPGYKFCFVLDKTSMFTVTSTKRDGTKIQHHVKPLQIIWTKFPRWNSTNTVHIDDLSRNFALNLSSGLKCTAYYRRKSSARLDAELLGIAQYLEKLATSGANFDHVEFANWSEVVRGAAPLVVYKSNDNNNNNDNTANGDEKDNEKKRSSNS